MITTKSRIFQVMLWCLWIFSTQLHIIEATLENEIDPQKPAIDKLAEEQPWVEMQLGKCFHTSREHCPTEGTKCKNVDSVSVVCCDINSFQWKEILEMDLPQNTRNLHVLNPNIDELDLSHSIFRRLTSLALTDGNIGKVVGQFSEHSSIACLNISNNNLINATLQPSNDKIFAYLTNLTVLDVSANNLTKIPLNLAHISRKISVDLSGNNYITCGNFKMIMESDSSSLVTFLHYDRTSCALILDFNWFKDVRFMKIDRIPTKAMLNASCRNIRPAGSNCTCLPARLKIDGDEITMVVAVDCSQRHLKVMPVNLPPHTYKLNVSHNNITSLLPIPDSSYKDLTKLYVDYNDIQNIAELEGTTLLDNIEILSVTNNKFKTIPIHFFTNRFNFQTLMVADNYVYCDCNTVIILKRWLRRYSMRIPDYKDLKCESSMVPVMKVNENEICRNARI